MQPSKCFRLTVRMLVALTLIGTCSSTIKCYSCNAVAPSAPCTEEDCDEATSSCAKVDGVGAATCAPNSALTQFGAIKGDCTKVNGQQILLFLAALPGVGGGVVRSAEQRQSPVFDTNVDYNVCVCATDKCNGIQKTGLSSTIPASPPGSPPASKTSSGWMLGGSAAVVVMSLALAHQYLL